MVTHQVEEGCITADSKPPVKDEAVVKQNAVGDTIIPPPNADEMCAKEEETLRQSLAAPIPAAVSELRRQFNEKEGGVKFPSNGVPFNGTIYFSLDPLCSAYEHYLQSAATSYARHAVWMSQYYAGHPQRGGVTGHGHHACSPVVGGGMCQQHNHHHHTFVSDPSRINSSSSYNQVRNGLLGGSRRSQQNNQARRQNRARGPRYVYYTKTAADNSCSQQVAAAAGGDSSALRPPTTVSGNSPATSQSTVAPPVNNGAGNLSSQNPRSHPRQSNRNAFGGRQWHGGHGNNASSSVSTNNRVKRLGINADGSVVAIPSKPTFIIDMNDSSGNNGPPSCTTTTNTIPHTANINNKGVPFRKGGRARDYGQQQQGFIPREKGGPLPPLQARNSKNVPVASSRLDQEEFPPLVEEKQQCPHAAVPRKATIMETPEPTSGEEEIKTKGENLQEQETQEPQSLAP